jgi:hypothetical protein
MSLPWAAARPRPAGGMTGRRRANFRATTERDAVAGAAKLAPDPCRLRRRRRQPAPASGSTFRTGLGAVNRRRRSSNPLQLQDRPRARLHAVNEAAGGGMRT